MAMTTTLHVAQTIKGQVGTGVLMSLGASSLRATEFYGMAGLSFTARILPFRADGQRGTAVRKMGVRVTLNSSDRYDVLVAYVGRGGARKVHYEADDVDAEMLPRLMLALDFDGESVLNPRVL